MTDLQWLAATILLTLLGAFPYILQRTLRIGLPRALGNPCGGDDAEMAPWAQRAKRAHAHRAIAAAAPNRRGGVAGTLKP
jgi:hypothetical protein